MKEVRDPTLLAKQLAQICWEADEVYGSPLSGLTLQWLVDHYMCEEVERRIYPRFLKIFQKLKDNYTKKKPFEFFKGEAYALQTPERRVVVMQHEFFQSDGGYVIIDNYKEFALTKNIVFHDFNVAKIWARLGRNSIGSIDRPTIALLERHGFDLRAAGRYADCRDNGHILNYNRLGDRGRCDRVLANANETFYWSFLFESLHTELIVEA